jgi:replication factor C large subunit
MDDWTETYRPKQLSEVVGNKKVVYAVQQWANAWARGNPTKKGVIFSGNPGIGKTSCAQALALQYHWTPIELNASDARNATRIKAVATAGAIHQTFDDDGSFSSTQEGGRKLIILDEADNLYESKRESSVDGMDYSDYGGKKAIVETVRVTKQPIILIVNEYYNLVKGSGAALQSLCLHLRFFPPYPSDIVHLLQRICHQERIHVDKGVLEAFSQHYNGDMRAILRDLEALAINRTHVTLEDYVALGNRDHKEKIFDILRAIFQTANIRDIRSAIHHIDEDPNLLLHWVAENVPKSYTAPVDLAAAYEALSYADRWLGRVGKRNQYGFWSYAYDEMSAGVSFAKSSRVQQATYTFPYWLKNVNKRKGSVGDGHIPIENLSEKLHCSTEKIHTVLLPFLEKIIANQPDVGLALAKEPSLCKEEFANMGMVTTIQENEESTQARAEKRHRTSQKEKDEHTDKGASSRERKQQNLSIDV